MPCPLPQAVVLAQMQARLPDVLTLYLLAMGLILLSLLSLLCAMGAIPGSRSHRLLPLLRTGLVFALVFSVALAVAPCALAACRRVA